MNVMKLQLKWACRIEHLGAGFYMSLSRNYRKDNDLSQTLARFSRDELKHGVMFGRAYHKEFCHTIMTAPWTFLGRALAFSQIFVPLRLKLKSLSGLESKALFLMNRELRSEKTNPYRVILKKIKPDEERHASFYESRYGSNASMSRPVEERTGGL